MPSGYSLRRTRNRQRIRDAQNSPAGEINALDTETRGQTLTEIMFRAEARLAQQAAADAERLQRERIAEQAAEVLRRQDELARENYYAPNFGTATTSINMSDLSNSLAYGTYNSNSLRFSPSISRDELISKMHELMCTGLCNYCAGKNRSKVEELAASVI